MACWAGVEQCHRQKTHRNPWGMRVPVSPGDDLAISKGSEREEQNSNTNSSEQKGLHSGNTMGQASLVGGWASLFLPVSRGPRNHCALIHLKAPWLPLSLPEGQSTETGTGKGQGSQEAV